MRSFNFVRIARVLLLIGIIVGLISSAAGCTARRATTNGVPPLPLPATQPSTSQTLPLPETANRPAAPDTSETQFLLWDSKALSEVRQRVRAGDAELAPAVARLRRDADAALKAGPFSVIDKKSMPPSSDKHDYMSLAIYYWPDPASPDGKPYINRDGQVNPESSSNSYDKASLDRMISSVSTLGLAYYLTGEETYGAHAGRLLRTWFLDPSTRMNPNLEYGQGIPGKDTGGARGIIETVSLLQVLDASSFLTGATSWTAQEQRDLKSWFRAYLTWLQESKNGRAESAAKNNHGTWYDAQVVAYALFIGESDLASKRMRSSGLDRIASQIEPDGRQPQELTRTKSFHYSLYNLEAFISLAILGEHVGVDLWRFSTPDGRSIRTALDFMTPYLDGRKWPYPEITSQTEPGFASYLRRAAIRYKDKAYADLANKLLGPGTAADRLNLLCPDSTASTLR